MVQIRLLDVGVAQVRTWELFFAARLLTRPSAEATGQSSRIDITLSNQENSTKSTWQSLASMMDSTFTAKHTR